MNEACAEATRSRRGLIKNSIRDQARRFFVLAVALFCALRPALATNLRLMTWNVAGNGQTDWTTNNAQVRAIGRIVQHLRPDVLTLQEIPFPETDQMTNFVATYLDGYQLARHSGTDGVLRSVIISRFPIVRQQKWLDGVLLNDFGYDGRFTRDLFEAEIAVPGWTTSLHVFTTHLKSGFDADSIARRGAEALAISNFVANTYLPAHPDDPFLITGDFNENDSEGGANGAGAVNKLLNDAVGLHRTDPRNPFTGSDNTFSSRGSLSSRLDYILPDARLYASIIDGSVFRTAVLDPLPPTLGQFDDLTASDHLPVMILFREPGTEPFVVHANSGDADLFELQWPALPGRDYQIEQSADLVQWSPVSGHIQTAGTNGLWISPISGAKKFYRLQLLP